MDTPVDIDAVIDNAYRVFARYKLGGRIIVCKCPSCVGPQAERELIKTPLRALSAETLAEYTNSAHDWDGKVEEDLKYFLPRYFELLALGQVPSTIGVDTCLRRLSNADYRTTWPEAEAKAVDDAFVALLRLALEVAPQDGYDELPTYRPDPGEDLICMVAFAGGDVGMMLAAWDEDRSRTATLHLANMIGNANWGKRRLRNGSWYELREPRVEAQAEGVMTWLLREETRARLEAACLAEPEPAMADLLSFAEGIVAGRLAAGA
jgi:hypothetical protein